ncbi:hypothetical protein [Mesorhizobium sp.]|uniref:hypothetical protein n=1 Tax=Mesorhizobium sp. TaxID=1871066 RepID=UPI000FE46A30|nr:hypothetical protein [Mesorhizobium sp.]RWP16339.1 MAG: hypothetical protein EOR01_27370 [Mesorhizobium sp.]RWQ26048.1 MAG: hypothetical protein EOS19_27565 [Mesorhizobium sp.]
MTAPIATTPRRRSRAGIAALVLIAVGISGLAAANGHLVYVSVTSQPDCVPHAREAGSAAGNVYRAAKSSC